MILRNSLNSEMVFDYCSLYQDDAVEILRSNGKDSSLLYDARVFIISNGFGSVTTIGLVNPATATIQVYQVALNESTYLKMLTTCEDVIRGNVGNRFTSTMTDNSNIWLELSLSQRYERQLLTSRYGYTEPSWYANKVILKLPVTHSRGLTYY